MEECLRNIKMTNRYIRLNAVKEIRERMHHCQFKSLQPSDQFDDNKYENRTENRTLDESRSGFKWSKFSTPDIIKYVSLVIVIWIFFAIYSYLYNRCMLYGGSNCVHMNPFTYQNCNSDNYIF